MADNRVRLYGRNGPGLTRNFAYNNSNSNNNEELRRAARNMNNLIHSLHGGGPQSPARKPKAVNVSKYQKMLKNLENKNNNNNNKPNNENKNVVSWLNSSMAESKKSKIPKNKRVFLLTDLTKNGKIKHVWDRRFLNKLIESAETLPVSRRREVRKNNDPFFTSPLTRNKFSKNDIKAYPPTDATKKIIKRIMNGRVLEAKVNKIMKIKNRESNILGTIKRGIRKGDITTEKQIEELALIYRVTGKEIFMSGHKKSDNYYKAYVDGNFKPHHIKFMKNAPTVISELYGPFITKNNAPGTVPLYKLPSEATKYLSQFEKYVSGKEPANWKNSFPIDARRPFFVDVLRQVVRNGHVYYLKSDTMNEINTFKNANLRNKLREYYNWHDIVMHASS